MTDVSEPLAKVLQSIAGEVTGAPIPFGRSRGTPAVRRLAEYGMGTIISYGPIGDFDRREWISVDSLNHHLEINRRLIESL